MRKTVHEVLVEVADKYGLTVNDLKGNSRFHRVSHPRQEAYYQIFTQCPHISYPDMGRRIGGRDHTTCLSGVKAHCLRNNLSYENAKLMRQKMRESASVWIRSTVLPQCVQDYRRATSIYAQGVPA